MSSQPTTVSGVDILNQEAPKAISVQPLTALQRAGLVIALGVGIFSFLALIPIMGVWVTHVPPPPSIAIDSSNDPQVITDTVKTFETYKMAAEIAAEQPLKWFDGLFTKILYPLLTLVLGYIFGAGRQGNDEGEA